MEGVIGRRRMSRKAWEIDLSTVVIIAIPRGPESHFEFIDNSCFRSLLNNL
jgi:hypothetical protein